jgi:hypothetical protein
MPHSTSIDPEFALEHEERSRLEALRSIVHSPYLLEDADRWYRCPVGEATLDTLFSSKPHWRVHVAPIDDEEG